MHSDYDMRLINMIKRAIISELNDEDILKAMRGYLLHQEARR